MFSWFFKRSLNEVLNATEIVKVKGIKFKIKKIDVLNYLDGSNVFAKVYGLWASGKGNEVDEASQKKVKKYLSEILVAGVVSPKLSFKDDGIGVFVESLFVDMEIVNELYMKIIEFTYGKKKLKRLVSAGNG